MKLLLEMQQISELFEIEETLCRYEGRAARYKNMMNEMLAEGMIDGHNGPLEAQFDKLDRMFAATRRGLGLANKLKTPEERKYHKRRLMMHMNQIRKELYEVMLQLGMGEDESTTISNSTMDRDRERRVFPR